MAVSTPVTEQRAFGLLVDGDQLFLSVLQRVLCRRRIETFAATSTDSALRLPTVSHLDFALVDLNLQMSSHPKLAESLRQRYPGIRLILMIDREDIQTNVAGGGTISYLPKAMNIDALLRALAV